MDVFKNLKEEFNIDETIQEAEAIIDETSNKIDEISESIERQKYNLEDKEYLKIELQDLIASDRLVLETLKAQVTAGAGPNYAVVYATLSKSVRENISKLIDLEKQITDYQVIESNEDFRERTLQAKERAAERRLTNKSTPNNQYTQNNNTFILNGKEQFDIMKNVKTETIEIEHPQFDLSEGK